MTISRRHLIAAAATLPIAKPALLLAQSKELRLGILTPNGHPWNVAAVKVGERLKAETNGRLNLTVFHSGQLGNEAAMLQQMQSGALDMGWIMAAELGSRVPAIGAITAPYIVDSTAKIAKLVRDPVAMGLFEVLPRETGCVGLAWGITGMRAVFAAKEIDGVAGLKGMKLRINPTPVYRDFYQLLGAAPTPIPTPQVFDAMTNGQVDGLEADLEFSWNQRFDKVSKTILQMNAIFMPVIALASGRVWQGMPAADRELIQKTVRAALDEQIDALAVNEPKLVEQFKAAGANFKLANPKDAEAVVAEFDKIWLPKAPVLADLRKAGKSISA
ncbi:C4-dicarboxylate ABC transporter permease [Bosea sp. Tri-44]|uniref:TRAP transporter substrate-binding protein n=1 Tax=Bosea sp. Tri-44 TaxID=1972137 RepID=UPI00100FF009|nr:TRAP transporter substrate-binding protein [Bosea sp. Tri-44]RXT52732.1 C4-dicarboxylate ABC transporter permease [Bosea sp. Tri-44]